VPVGASEIVDGCLNEENMRKIYVLGLMMVTILLSCEGDYHLTLVNKTKHKVTIFRPKKIPIRDSDVLKFFRPGGPTNNRLTFDFMVKPFTVKKNISVFPYETQFNTTDGKLHIIILDVDSLTHLAEKKILDSVSIRRAYLKVLTYAKEEMDNKDRFVTYDNK
jgi:hypothetical protein